jgi:PAS domain S-box-containing protein
VATIKTLFDPHMIAGYDSHAARYAAMLRLMPDRVIRVDRRGNKLAFKGTDEDLAHGLSAEVVVGRNLQECLPPNIAQQCLGAIARTLDTGTLQTFTYQIPHPWPPHQGEPRDYEVRLVVCGEDEVLMIERDISEQKRAERALQLSEVRNTIYLNAIPDILFRIRRDGTYLDARADKDSDLAIPAHEMLGRTVYEMLPPEVAAQRMFYVEQALQTGTAQLFEYQFLTRGTIHDYEARIVVCGADEVLVIVRDITQRKQAEQHLQENANQLAQLTQQLQTLNASLEQQVQERTAQLEHNMQALQALNQQQDEFLHAVSHDLRTPMMGMRLVLQNLQQKTDDPLLLPRMVLDRMVQSVDRQLAMIRSLLETHAVDGRGLELTLAPVSLAALVGSIAIELEPLLFQHQATLVQQISPKLPWVMADPAQIQRVFENLVTNALQHNGPGITLTLDADTFPPTSLQDARSWVRCTVQDTGVGMTQAECDHLFDRYSRGNRARRSAGIGLGLYLCRQIVQAHGGEIGAISSPGQGATFWFTLPISERPTKPMEFGG